MATKDRGIEHLRLADSEHWEGGPPLELFAELRGKCPAHWSEEMSDFPDEDGFWSVTRAADMQTVSRDWQTYSSWLGGTQIATHMYPLDMQRQEFIAMDPPRHDRIKALFQAGFTPKRIAEREPSVRQIVNETWDSLDGRDGCDLVTDFAQPVVSRVIGEFVGIPLDEDAGWAALVNTLMGWSDEALRGGRTMHDVVDEVFERAGKLIAERRRHPTDDLASLLVHAEVDGELLSDDEIVNGISLLMEAGNDSTKATYCSGMRALMEHPDQRQLLLDDPSLIPGAVEESLRMFPAFSSMRRTATHDTELAGQKIKEGEKVVMWYPSAGRDETVYEDPDRFDVTRNPEHQAFGAGGRHFCLGFALARLELNVMFEETLRRHPEMEIDGDPAVAVSWFVNQMTSLPVKLRKD